MRVIIPIMGMLTEEMPVIAANMRMIAGEMPVIPATMRMIAEEMPVIPAVMRMMPANMPVLAAVMRIVPGRTPDTTALLYIMPPSMPAFAAQWAGATAQMPKGRSNMPKAPLLKNARGAIVHGPWQYPCSTVHNALFPHRSSYTPSATWKGVPA